MIKVLLIFLTFSAVLVRNDGMAFGKDNSHLDLDLLSSASIFKPIIADPKWPRFSLAYQHYTKKDKKFGCHVFAPNVGAVLPLIRNKLYNSTVYELSIHGGVFAIMDIGARPTVLVNSDYFIGPALAIKHKDLYTLLRFSHTSSHLGDEFILGQQGRKVSRINLSYEVVEAIIGYEFIYGLRPIVGIGYIVHAEPNNYKSWEFLAGIDYRPGETPHDDYIRPIFGIYSKTSKNYNWRPTISVKGGIELKNKVVIGKSLQVLLEYYNGNSINGQFYQDRDRYIGISVNVNF